MEAVIPKKTKKFQKIEFQLSKNVFQLKLLSKSENKELIKKVIKYSLKKAVRAQ